MKSYNGGSNGENKYLFDVSASLSPYYGTAKSLELVLRYDIKKRKTIANTLQLERNR